MTASAVVASRFFSSITQPPSGAGLIWEISRSKSMFSLPITSPSFSTIWPNPSFIEMKKVFFGPIGAGFFFIISTIFFWRFSMPMIRLPPSCSISRKRGKVLKRLMLSGLPAWMPPIRGSASLSRASRPRRRRTKEARVSSPLSLRLGTRISQAMRILPGQEISFDARKGSGLVGTIIITPSGRRCKA